MKMIDGKIKGCVLMTLPKSQREGGTANIFEFVNCLFFFFLDYVHHNFLGFEIVNCMLYPFVPSPPLQTPLTVSH